jgi:hypothetical protein
MSDFGSLCGLKSDISLRPRSANKRHRANSITSSARLSSEVLRDQIQSDNQRLKHEEGDCAVSRITRRVLIRTTGLAAGAATFGILTRRGDAAEFTWRYGNELVPTHSMNVHLQRAAERIRSDSGGRMEVQIFPNNQLGGVPTCCRSCAPA